MNAKRALGRRIGGKERSEKPPALYLPTAFLRLPENKEVLMRYKEEVIGSAPALYGGFHAEVALINSSFPSSDVRAANFIIEKTMHLR